jgi:hypothetical protein
MDCSPQKFNPAPNNAAMTPGSLPFPQAREKLTSNADVLFPSHDVSPRCLILSGKAPAARAFVSVHRFCGDLCDRHLKSGDLGRVSKVGNFPHFNQHWPNIVREPRLYVIMNSVKNRTSPITLLDGRRRSLRWLGIRNLLMRSHALQHATARQHPIRTEAPIHPESSLGYTRSGEFQCGNLA